MARGIRVPQGPVVSTLVPLEYPARGAVSGICGWSAARSRRSAGRSDDEMGS